jgi:thymidine kinase
MAKLYFRYGVVGSAKTLNLLAVAHNYRAQNKKVILIKPAMDVRFGAGVIGTRAGLQMPADVEVAENSDIVFPSLDHVVCVLVDEAQFLPISAIERLHAIAHDPVNPVPVICYGLRADFRLQAFPAAKRLFELADTLEEIKTTCTDCNKKAVFNLKLCDGRPVLDGPSVELGFEEKYLPVCADCYNARHSRYLTSEKQGVAHDRDGAQTKRKTTARSNA